MMEEVNFEDAIISKVADETVEKMQVCFYVPDAAAIGVNVESNPDRRIPYASVDRNAICVTVEDYLEDSVHGIPIHIPDFLPEYLQDEHLSLELNGEHGLYNTHFASNSIVNVEEANKIRFRDSRSYSPTAKFLIHGRLFVCKQLKYTYANGHQDPIVEGIFYPYI